MFCREFSLEDVYIIWDIILYNEYVNENTEKYSFIFMEYICIAMIFKLRDTLKDADQNECLTILFKYPETKDIMEIIKLSRKVEQAINERLNGKNSNVYDILGIMKPIESEPTRIFSQNLFNQSGNKTSQNNSKTDNNSGTNKKNNYNNNKSENNNTINLNNNDTNENENTNTFEQFDEDEKENINLDSVNHNYSNNNNDLSSQAKSFFNNAMNSLSNFGGIIKDQLQNAKDTVIDSFTGNDTNSNKNYYNEYNDNYQQNDDNNYDNNYNNSTNDYNENNNNTNNNNNESNNNNMKSSTEQNDENKNQSSTERKVSFDSNNELAYNKQDIIDIVNKLKEIDTKYNMFFNDEDKKNFRIIIDYLKPKV
jgi:TusA-related sulfurtransferase